MDYAGRLTAHLPMSKRLIIVKADGSVSVHADDRAYKPLNWMSAPCRLEISDSDDEALALGVTQLWQVRSKEGDTLIIPVTEEILVLEKRLRIKEEVHITTTRRTIVHSETVPLLSETVNIESFDEASPSSASTESPPHSQQTGSS